MVLVLDGLSILYRAHAGGLPAVLALIRAVLSDDAADGLAIALDARGADGRRARFPAYKAHRKPMPYLVKALIAPLREVAAARDVPVHQIVSTEADDVLATLVTRIPGPVRVVTGDRDLFQLIDARVAVRFLDQKNRTRPLWDLAAFRAHHPFAPALLPTWKAMVGDPSDGLPGVPGLGTPTANRLCATHGNAAGILEALDRGQIGNRRVPPLLTAGRETFVLQESLHRLDRDVPLGEPLFGPVHAAWHHNCTTEGGRTTDCTTEGGRTID